MMVPVSAGGLPIARLHFGEIHHCAGDVVHVVREDVHHNVSDRFDDVAVGQTGCAHLLEVGVTDFAALHHNAARELEDRIGLISPGGGVAGVGDVLVCESDLAAEERVRAQAVAAQVALGDNERDLLADLGVEAAAAERAAEVEIALKRGRRRAEHAEEVRHST